MQSAIAVEKETKDSVTEISAAEQSIGSKIPVALLTAGRDRPYVFGLVPALLAKGAVLDFIASDELESSFFCSNPGINFMNLRGDCQLDPSLRRRMARVLLYYGKLIRYAATAKPAIFHILWNNKFEVFDRTLLMLYYRFLGKRIVLTVHNVNAGRRDASDTWLNRLTLRAQYRLVDHLFVHTEKMKQELADEFGVPGSKMTVIPFGINNSVPVTALTSARAKKRLGLHQNEKAILFFGRVTPYKGVEYLADAFRRVLQRHGSYRLIIAGVPECGEDYWSALKEKLRGSIVDGKVLLRADFVPDEETEVYFKAADVLVLPYRHIYQSGVLFLGHSFGLPVLAADVGSLKEDIVEGQTGFTFRPDDSDDLARAIEQYFASSLYTELDERRLAIQAFSNGRHSWDVVGDKTRAVYESLLRT